MDLSERAAAVLAYLDSIGVSYEILRHKEVFSCEESREVIKVENCTACKNLFVKDTGSGYFYLIVLKSEKHADLKMLSQYVGAKRFVFATDEELMSILGVTHGSVSPFALLNDKGSKTRLMMDDDVLNSKRVRFHPNDNTATVVLAMDGFMTYAKSLKKYIMKIKTF